MIKEHIFGSLTSIRCYVGKTVNNCYTDKKAVTLTDIANNDFIDRTDLNRERYVSGVCTIDLLNEIPQGTLVRVLRLFI